MKKIVGYTAAGIIWYQGCSDDHHAMIYDKLLSTVIRRWRKDWQEELPFLFVQLAPFEEWRLSTGKNYPILRECQQKVADNEPKCYMASIMDVGSRYDIHPKKKRQPGQRLAGLALHYVYDQSETNENYEAPRITNIEKNESELIVHFDYVQNGLVLEKNESAFAGLNYLFQVWLDQKEVSFGDTIKADQVVLYVDGLSNARMIEVSFADRSYCEVNLKADSMEKNRLPVRPYARKMVWRNT